MRIEAGPGRAPFMAGWVGAISRGLASGLVLRSERAAQPGEPALRVRFPPARGNFAIGGHYWERVSAVEILTEHLRKPPPILPNNINEAVLTVGSFLSERALSAEARIATCSLYRGASVHSGTTVPDPIRCLLCHQFFA